MTRRLPLASTVPLLFVTALLLALVPAGAWSAPASEEVDVIVVLHDGFAPGGHEANRAAAARIAREHGVQPTSTYGTALFGFAASVPSGRMTSLRNDPRVDYVDHDRPVEAYGEAAPWGITRIGAPEVHGASNTGVGIHVYVLDTGIDTDHADLVGNVSPDGFAYETCRGPGSRCLQPWDDDHGHGTHVAGTVAAVDNEIDVIGVAPGATLHAVKVLDSNGSGSWSGVAAGVDWVTQHVQANTLGGKAVINMSLGGSGSKKGTCEGSLHLALCNARDAGVVSAVAAGNSYADAEGHVPAAYDDAVITVSATKSSDDWPAWSNWGDAPAPWDNDSVDRGPHAPVAIAAPGVSVLSTALGGGTTTKSGTSMAAPHVAGAVALYLDANTQQADGSAFTNVRAGLLAADESTDPTATATTWENTSGYPHEEDFLDVRSLGTSTPVTDVAVTGVAAPTNVVEGDAVSVDVTVENVGNQDVSSDISVTLRDSTAGVDIGTQSISNGLTAGTSKTLTFSWTAPTVIADETHTLTATHSTSGDEDPSDDSRSTDVLVEEDVTDVAVTDVSAPSSVVGGDTTAVDVTVANVGNQDVSSDISVTLRDSTAGVDIGTQSISNGLTAGTSKTLTFSWTAPTVIADETHTLTATHSTSGDEDPSDDSASTSVTVTVDAATMHVADLASASINHGSSWTPSVIITVHDANGALVDGATVTGTWSDRASGTQTCLTGTDGTCVITDDQKFHKNVSSVTFTVDNVEHGTLTYDSGSNLETSIAVTKP